jgi:GTP pyrophosphokinase
MHAVAEMGVAAHWIYKEGRARPEREYRTIALLQNITKMQSEIQGIQDSREFLRELKMDLYEDEIFVFTPKGKIVKLAKGATPVDFAYAIHSEVGSQCAGAKVNGSIMPLKTELKSGDIVEIITSKKAHPSESWLKFVKSSNARYKIRSWLRKDRESVKKPEPEEAPGRKSEKTAHVSIPDTELFKVRTAVKQNKTALSIAGTAGVLIKLSQCCQPIPGDDVVGFITRGRGITVHKKSCPQLARLTTEQERFINIVWEGSETTYPVKLAIHAIDRANLLRDIADELSTCKTNLMKVEAQVTTGDNAVIKMVLGVKSVAHLREITSRLKKVKSVTSIQKLNEKVLLK